MEAGPEELAESDPENQGPAASNHGRLQDVDGVLASQQPFLFPGLQKTFSPPPPEDPILLPTSAKKHGLQLNYLSM